VSWSINAVSPSCEANRAGALDDPSKPPTTKMN
jgi:hypothetical protein